MNHEKYIEDLKKQTIYIAENIINNNINIIEGVKKINSLICQLGVSENEKYVIFKAIDSETDDVPVGEARKHWNKDALIRIDEEVKSYINKIKKPVIESCKELVKELSSEEKDST